MQVDIFNNKNQALAIIKDTVCTVFIRIKVGLKYTQGLKYTPGSAAEWKK